MASNPSSTAYFTYRSAIGPLTIACTDDAILRIAFGTCTCAGERRATALSNLAANQIHEYLAGKRRVFDLPLRAEGTAFQQAVWNGIAAIPFGQTRTYGDVAASIGHGRAYRAVGMACNANPLPIVIPCHRVVGAHGTLGGYGGGVALKQRLLELERRFA